MAEVFLKLVNMSISASWLILAVLMIRVILKKAPKWTAVLLWGIVAIRLICPVSLESAMSLMPSGETIPETVLSEESFQVQTGITPVDTQVNEYLGSHYYEGVTVPADNGFDVMNSLSIIWAAGVLLLGVYMVVSYWRLQHQVNTAVKFRDNIFQCEKVESPFVLGFVRPRIYIPFGMNEEQLNYVIVHEEAHINRKDHWWKILGFFILVLHWFNPLVWLSYVLLCKDMEKACDEKVIRYLEDGQRADYSETLLSCSASRRMIGVYPLAFGEVSVKDRVKSVLNYKKPAFWVVIVAVVACVVVGMCFLTNPVEKLTLEEAVSGYREGVEETIPTIQTEILGTFGSADVDHDGENETFRVTKTGSQIYQLEVLDPDGSTVWYEEAATVHAGENSLFLYTENEKGYILRYKPYEMQGVGSYSYELFWLENGKPKEVKSGSVGFYYNDFLEKDVVAKREQFAQEVMRYLKPSTVLLSTYGLENVLYGGYEVPYTMYPDNLYSTFENEVVMDYIGSGIFQEFGWDGAIEYEDQPENLEEKLEQLFDLPEITWSYEGDQPKLVREGTNVIHLYYTSGDGTEQRLEFSIDEESGNMLRFGS